MKSSPEIDLLLSCAHSQVNPQQSEQINHLVKQNLDWSYIHKIAWKNQLTALLYYHLQNREIESIPSSIWERIEKYYNFSVQRNQLLTSALFDLLNLFETHKIPAIPYKGSTLSIDAYRNLKQRSFGDIDILVHPQDINEAKSLLKSQGYILTNELFWENEFRNKDDTIVIDLHRAITPKFFPFDLGFENCLNRIRSIQLEDVSVPSFSPEDLVLILSVYLARDTWQVKEKLIQVCDVAELIKTHHSIDWEWLIKESTRLGCKRMLLLVLFLAKELLDLKLPEIVLDQMKFEPQVPVLALQVAQYFFDENKDKNGLERKLFYIKIRERFQDIIPHFPYLIQYVMTPSQTDRDFILLPNSIDYLYYLVRPIRLIWQYRPTFLQKYKS